MEAQLSIHISVFDRDAPAWETLRRKEGKKKFRKKALPTATTKIRSRLLFRGLQPHPISMCVPLSDFFEEDVLFYFLIKLVLDELC